MDISVVIVNYNTADIIPQCLDALLQQKHISYEIIVVDNQSQDNSLKVLDRYRHRIAVIVNETNAGFAGGANLGFSQATGRYFYSLNPDAFLQEDTDLQKIVAFMDSHPVYGMAGTYLESPNRRLDYNVIYDYPSEKKLKYPIKNLPGEIAWVFGASMVLRREVFQSVRGFDEDYFVTGEDNDIGLRVRKAGYSIGVIKNVIVNHIGNASSRNSAQYAARSRRVDSELKFYKKHYHPYDVKNLVRKKFKRARRHLAFHKLRKFFIRTKKISYRCEKYQAQYDLYYRFLREIHLQ